MTDINMPVDDPNHAVIAPQTDETTSSDVLSPTTEIAVDQLSDQSSILADDKPLALVKGQPLTECPKDLYIPPDALEIVLETFEGPLDLLLYLIRKHNLDILNIPIAKITSQYMEYIALMHHLRLELAAEYLVMAATLAEIKSLMLLPKQETIEEEEEDPRARLIRQLQEYERFKEAAINLDQLPRYQRDTFSPNIMPPKHTPPRLKPTIDVNGLVKAFIDVLKRADQEAVYTVVKEGLSVREKMTQLLDLLNQQETLTFHQWVTPEEGREGIVAAFLAILECAKLFLIDIVQNESLGPIYLKLSQTEQHHELDFDPATLSFN